MNVMLCDSLDIRCPLEITESSKKIFIYSVVPSGYATRCNRWPGPPGPTTAAVSYEY